MNPPTPMMGSAMNAAGRPEVVVLMTSSTSSAQATPHSGFSFAGVPACGLLGPSARLAETGDGDDN
jgi:hypothetical protein